MAGKAGHRGFGALRRLPSKRWQATYVGPDGMRHKAPTTFVAKIDGEAWLAAEARAISSDSWTPPSMRRPKAAALTFGSYAAEWIAGRELKPSTRSHYGRVLRSLLLPAFEDVPLKHVTRDAVTAWHGAMPADRPTQRAHAYGLLRAVMTTAVADELVPTNPCAIKGAGTTRRARKIRPATLAELETIAAHLPEKYRVMALLTAWCALRFGEVVELRRKDIDLRHDVIRVRRGVARTDAGRVIGTPKSEAGVRDVAIPPHLVPTLRAYLDAMPDKGRERLLFPASDGVTNMAPATLYRVWYPARAAAGRSDLRWHDLRHTGAVLAAQTGATLAELMARLGHSTPGAAMRYQHAAAGRDAQIAAALSRLAKVGD